MYVQNNPQSVTCDLRSSQFQRNKEFHDSEAPKFQRIEMLRSKKKKKQIDKKYSSRDIWQMERLFHSFVKIYSALMTYTVSEICFFFSLSFSQETSKFSTVNIRIFSQIPSR